MARKNRGTMALLAFCAGLCGPNGVDGAQAKGVVWEIGKADSSTADLALGPKDHGKFSADSLYVVGRSKAREGWAYCHPGPADAWAGGRAHVFTILFEIEDLPASAEGDVEVRLLLYDSHSNSPPVVDVALNGERQSKPTPKGLGDASIGGSGPGLASRLSFAFPAARLRKGPNEIEIRNARGSWFLYDAVQFLAPTGIRLGESPSFYKVERVEDTVFLRRRNDRLTQVVRASIIAAADEPVSATLETAVEAFGGRETIEHTVTVRPGKQWVYLDVPPLKSWPAKAVVSLTAPGGVPSSATTTVRPHRTWTVYLAPHSHVDVGYTEVQTKILELQKDNIVKTMEFVEEHPEFKGDALFCWNVEVMWAVKAFLHEADAAQRARFLRHVRMGSLSLDALFGNELTGLCSPEEMVRLIGYAGELVRDHRLTIDSAMITDVPGYSWGMVAALAGAGVKYLDFGPNHSARIGSARRAWRDRPFYWVAPDGKGRVLAWSAPHGYHRVWNMFQKEKDLDPMLYYLRQLEKNPNYPFDVTHLRMCTGDNGRPPFHLSRIVHDWNAKWASPRLVIGRTHDPFIHLEKKYGDQIPSFAGDFSPYWEDGAGSSADETTRNRRAAKALVAAEKIWSAARVAAGAGKVKIPAEALDGAWDNVILYNEHTWGAHNSISQPDVPFVAAQWKIKQAFALDAERQAEKIVSDGMAALAGQIKTGDDVTIVVFNPCSWERTDIARYETAQTKPFAIVDSRGKPVAFVRSDDGRAVSFVARDVPPLGYRTYRIVAPDRTKRPAVKQPFVDPEKGILKSRFFELALDPKTTSVARVSAPGGLLRGKRVISSHGFNRYIYCRDGDPKKISGAGNVEMSAARPDSPDGAALVLRSKAPGCKSLVQKIEIHSELPWIDITNTLDRGDVRDAEGIYFDFSFDGMRRRPAIQFDTAWALVRLEGDLIPGACKNWFCVQHGVEIRDKRQTVVLVPIDAPLIEVGEIHLNTRRHNLAEVDRLALDPPRILSFVMNNYWFTNYRASQPGKTSFRYRVYRYDGNDPVRSARCGIEAREPLRTTLVAGGNGGPLPADQHSFARVRPENVVVTAMAPAARGGTLVRLHEIAGKRAKVRLTLPAFGEKAERVDLWQRPQERIKVQDGSIKLEMGPREIVTVRVF